MKNNAALLYSIVLIIGDFIALIVGFVLAYVLRVRLDPRALVVQIPFVIFFKAFLLILPFWLIIFALLGLYSKNVYERRANEYTRLWVGCMVGIMAVITFDFFNKGQLFPARLVPIYAFLASFSLLFIERIILRFSRRLLFAKNIGVSRALIIGSGPETSGIMQALYQTASTGYHIVGYFGSADLVPKNIKLKQYKTIDSALENLSDIDTIIQTELFLDQSINQKILDSAQSKHISYRFIPAQSSFFTGNNKIELFQNFPVVAVHRTPLIGWGRVAKRLFDLLGATIGLILSTPIFLMVGIIIKLTDPAGPVFYKHRRVTRFGTTFDAYKLRSMYWKYCAVSKTNEQIFREMNREDLIKELAINNKVKKDPRIMPIGRFIRKTSLDELPQLMNVFRGELSIIGPRPVTKEELARYKDTSSLFLSIKPGITGLWQVSGRNEISYDERVKLDLFYVQHWSFLLDLKITYWTVLTMLRGGGH